MFLGSTRIWYLNHYNGCSSAAGYLHVNKWLCLLAPLAAAKQLVSDALLSWAAAVVGNQQWCLHNGDADSFRGVGELVLFVRTGHQTKIVILVQSTLQGRGGIFAQHRLKTTTAERLSTENLVDTTWTGPVGGRGVGEGWGTVTDGECLLTCVLTFGCAHAVRKKRRRSRSRREGALLAGGSKRGKMFQVTQQAVNLLLSRRLLKLIGLKA